MRVNNFGLFPAFPLSTLCRHDELVEAAFAKQERLRHPPMASQAQIDQAEALARTVDRFGDLRRAVERQAAGLPIDLAGLVSRF